MAAEAWEKQKPEAQALERGIARALGWLDANRSEDGFWAGMLQSNACMEAEWILAMHILGVEDHPLAAGMVQSILDRQRPDGSWEIFHDAPNGDINSTVESYAALRCAGLDPEDEVLRKARQWIFAHDGLTRIRVFTRYWLSLIGEWPWDRTPNVPPELIYFPRWFPFNIYNFASWARATLMPLSVLSVRRYVKRLPMARRLDELFPEGREHADYALPRRAGWRSWQQFFLAVDRCLHVYQSIGITPTRERAISLVLEWVVRRQDSDGAWGGIQPPWIYSLMALHAEGYALDHPVMARGIGALEEHWSYERDGATYVQASESPVWDTLLVLMAMQECGVEYADSPTMRRAVDWILEKQIRVPGDWSEKVPGVPCGGWAFERANTRYPDLDDTAVALIVLSRLRVGFPRREQLSEAIDLARDWVLAMQSRCGGWGAFDKDNDREILTRLPFCDFGETLDPPSVDVTAHVLEGLGYLGLAPSHPSIVRAVAYLRSEQEADGSWFGRWGVNHVYGTGAVLPALRAVGEDMRAEYVRFAARWLLQQQNEDGGWGESCASYMAEPLRGRGDSTPSQTAWALLGLLAVADPRHRDVIADGVRFLLSRQLADGTWDEPQYTGTGFPGYGRGTRTDLRDHGLRERLQQGTELQRGFMINYNLYRHYFPMMALGRARSFLQDGPKRVS